MSDYYDGCQLLSQVDINGNKPEILLCTSNRSAGKTTWWNRYCVKKFKDNGEKFMILYRYGYEVDECADKFFTDIRNIFFPNDNMTAKKKAKGVYFELYLNNVPCGYATALNNADQIKKYSHLMSDVKRMIFDEFQSETNHYCPNEVSKLISIHTSIARGKGEQARFVPVIMISNPVSLINPYYVELGISYRLREDSRFLKGDGFVLEQGFNEHASQAQLGTGFNRAFAGNKYVAYSAQNVYLNDNTAFIESVEGASKYICTIKCDGKNYAVREYKDLGIIYCDTHADLYFPVKIAVTTDDHAVNYVMLRQNEMYVNAFRFYFDRGCFRFKDLKCKEAIMKMVSY